MKKSNDTIGNRTRDLPTCNAVPQPTAPLRAPDYNSVHYLNLYWIQVSGQIHAPAVLTAGKKSRFLFDRAPEPNWALQGTKKSIACVGNRKPIRNICIMERSALSLGKQVTKSLRVLTIRRRSARS